MVKSARISLEEKMSAFTNEQVERYSRQIILNEIGGKGQKKLMASKVLVIGTGGLGAPCDYYLAAAGVGTLGIVDSDNVEINNLQRQIVHSTKTIGKPKVESAKIKLEELNTDVKIIVHNVRVNSSNIMDLIKDYDIIVDGSDNFPTRYLLNDACVLAKKPLIHAGILRFDGQIITIIPHEGPCYRCLFPDPPAPGMVPSCQEAGILGAVAGIFGVLQAAEAMKLILSMGEPLKGRLLVGNLLDMTFREVKIKRNPDCPICGDNPVITKLIDYEEFCGLRKKT